MPDIIQQLLDLKEWSQDSARYERRLNFRGGQLVQPGPGRQGYEGKDIGVAGGEAGAKKRIVLGLKPHEVIVYRRLVTERATKRGIQAPNWDTHPGRGFSSDNLQGQNIAKDIKRRLVGSRKGSVIGSGSGGTELFLSKVDQDKIIKRFGDNLITVPTDTGTGTKIVKLKDGINFKKKGKIYGTKYGVLFTKKDGANYKMGQKISNYIRGQHGPNFAFDAFDSANYHLTQMYRATNLKVPNKNYRPIYSTKGIIGYVDLTEKGGGKEYYHADYDGLDSKGKKALKINKNHPDATEINKLIEIIEGTKQDRTVLDNLFKKHGYKTPTFNQLLDSLMETEGRWDISSAIEKHHQYGVGREPGAIKLVTRDQNQFAKLIEGRVDTGKMTTETADRLLKRAGVQIVRDGTKIGAPDIKPEKQIKDWEKWIKRKSTTVFEKSDKNVLQKLTEAGFDVGDCE